MDNLTQSNTKTTTLSLSQRINKNIGQVIREKRQGLGLTIEKLSEILDIASGFLGLIERGSRGTSIRNLARIASFFNISVDELIGVKEIRNEKLTEYEILYKKFLY